MTLREKLNADYASGKFNAGMTLKVNYSKGGDFMLTFTAINEDGKYISYEYKTIEELRNEYWSDSIDMNVPCNDTPIADCKLNGIPLYFENFLELIKVFGLDRNMHR